MDTHFPFSIYDEKWKIKNGFQSSIFHFSVSREDRKFNVFSIFHFLIQMENKKWKVENWVLSGAHAFIFNIKPIQQKLSYRDAVNPNPMPCLALPRFDIALPLLLVVEITVSSTIFMRCWDESDGLVRHVRCFSRFGHDVVGLLYVVFLPPAYLPVFLSFTIRIGCQSTRHTVNSSPGRLVTQSTRHKVAVNSSQANIKAVLPQQ